MVGYNAIKKIGELYGTIYEVDAVIDSAVSIGATSVEDVEVSVSGVKEDDIVIGYDLEVVDDNLSVAYAKTGDGKIHFYVTNPTSSAINLSAQTIKVILFRPATNIGASED